MSKKRDYYDSLGVGRNASGDELKSAYRKLAKEYHPDVNSEPGAEERFKEVNEAYAVLSDQERRAAYDRFGHAGLKGMPTNFDFGFGDIFEEFFGFGSGGRRQRNAPRRGADLRYDINLDFEEAVFGVERQIEFTRRDTCSRCQGSGAEPGTTPVRCPTCDGAGEVRQVRQTFLGSMVNVTACPNCGGRGELVSSPCLNCSGRGIEQLSVERTISIPAGVSDGTQIRVGGEGEPGLNHGPRGDLYVLVRVKQHRFFRRKNDDILLDLSINLAQAALGSEIDVPTLEGDDKLRIPAGTQPGRIFRMRGKGVPHLKRNGRGDQLVIVSVDIPKTLTADQRRLFEQLSETLGSEVIPQERSLFDDLKDLISGIVD
ncbi:MAG: molecular chaperone DnaJ [Anaerolineae bacterium]|nr:MAG: molecular chaperone DnaJ [Anaerolineae bacterium]